MVKSPGAIHTKIVVRALSVRVCPVRNPAEPLAPASATNPLRAGAVTPALSIAEVGVDESEGQLVFWPASGQPWKSHSIATSEKTAAVAAVMSEVR